MQHWNQNYSNQNREDNIHREDDVTNRQSDFNQESRQQNNFNMPYGNEGYWQAYSGSHQQNHMDSNYNAGHFRNQQPYDLENDMLMEQHGRNIERNWDNFRNREDNFTNTNNAQNSWQRNPYMNRPNPNNYGETYNPDNRNYNPLFADDEGGFSGGYDNNDAYLRGGYNRDFGFDNRGSFYNDRPQSWSQNEGQNRWHREDDSSHNSGGFFGH